MKNEIIASQANANELQQQLTQFAMDNVSIEIYWLGNNSRIYYANIQACKTLGYSKQELLQLSLADVDPNYPINLWDEHWRILKQNKTITFETIHKRKDGSTFPVEVVANYVSFEGQEYNVGFAKDITERKRAHEKILDAQKRYSNLFNNAEIAIFRTRLDGTETLDCNEKFLELVGRTREEIIGKPSSTLWENPQKRAELVQLLKTEERVTDFEFGMLTPNGELRYCITSLKLSREDDILEGSIRDITKRRLAEEALLKSEKRFRTIFDSSSDMLMMLDENGFFNANKAALNNSGCTSVEEFCKHTPADFAPPLQANGISSQQLASEYIAAAFEKGFHRFEWLNKRLNGEVFPGEVTLTAMEQDNKHFLLVTMRDITERKLAEEALHEKGEFFRTISENVEDYIAVLDLEGKRIYNNPSYAKLFGDIEQIKGTDCFAEIHPEDMDYIKQTFMNTIQTGIGHKTEFRFVLPDGSIRSMESNGWLIKDTQGNPLRVIVVSHDITERKQNEAKFRDLAFHDALTQLPNRRLLDDRLEQAIAASKRNGHFGAVMFLDLDNFKPINDTHGHKAGDLLLIEVARRLSGCVREVDTVARFGGDEFVVVISKLDGDEQECIEQSRNLAEKIRASLAETYWLSADSSGSTKMIIHHDIQVSIGIALFRNNSAAEKILKYADKAMYKAKEAGRNTIYFYESGHPNVKNESNH